MKSKRFLALFLSTLFLLTCLAPALPGILFSAAQGGHFPYGTILVDFEEGIGSVAGSYEFTAAASDQHVSTGKASLALSSATDIGWGDARLYLNLGAKLGAADAPSAKMTHVGFHVTAPKGNHNDVSDGNVLIQDIQLASDKGWFSQAAGSTYYLLADGSADWITKKTIGSSAVVPGSFSGYLVLPVANFDAKGAAEILSETQATHLSMNFNHAGGDYGSVYLDTVFYTTGAVFPEQSVVETLNGTLLLDFEDGIDSVADSYGFTAAAVKTNAGTGSQSLQLSSAAAIGWDNARVYLNLGAKLGAADAPSAKMTHIGFHITGPKGNHNDVSDGNVLIQNIQLASDKGWFSYQAGSSYRLLADGSTEWTDAESIGTSTVIPGDFSGYVLLKIADFGVEDAAEILSETQATHLSLHFNQAGGDYGSVYLDSVFYTAQREPAPTEPFPYGTLLEDFEDGTDSVADSYDFTATVSDEHVAWGAQSLELSSDAAIGWGKARVYLNLGAKLGAADAPSAKMTYIGFHITGPKGNHNDVSDGDVLIQDIQLASDKGWFLYQGDSTYELLADGATAWTEAKSIRTSTVIPGDFSGYVRLKIQDFDVKNAAEILSETQATHLSMHFNQAGGEYGSVYLDAVFYSTEAVAPPPDDGDDVPKVEDIDAPSYAVNWADVAAVNGTGPAVKSQVIYLLNDFENGQADIDFLFTDKTQANKFTKELSHLHTGDGANSLKLSSLVALNWSNAVPYMRLPEGLGAAGTTSSQMTYIGFHIKTSLGADFRIQDVQLSSEGEWYTLSGQAAVYTMADGADRWNKGDMAGSSLCLKSNWSGFVALPIAEFYKEGLSLVPADVFSAKNSTYLQLHFNQAGGAAKSVFLDTLFYSLAPSIDTEAVQLVKADGTYVAGRSTPPANDVLTSRAESENILDIDGQRLFVRENTVGGLKGLLSVPSGMTIRVFKEAEEAADSEAVATGMVVKVYEGGTAKAAYVVADVRSTPVPARDFVITQKINDESSPLTLNGIAIACPSDPVETILTQYISVPYGMTAAVYDDGVEQEGGTPVRQGMTLRCFDPAEPGLYYEYTFADVEEVDITNGLTLTLTAGAAASVEGDTVTVPTGTTAGQLVAMVVCGEDQLALVVGADGMPVDDGVPLAAGMYLMLANDLYEEQGRWHIKVAGGGVPATTGTASATDAAGTTAGTTGDGGDAAATGAASLVVPLGLLAASAGGVFLLRRRKA